MIKFAYSNRPIIGEVYEQMDSMLGQIKDIVEPRYVNLYNHIRVEVEKRWEMLNIPLLALAYVLTPKYYHVSWLSSPAPGGGTKKRPHQDSEVQAGYMKALDKLIPDEECDNIRRQLSHYILSNGAFGTNHAIGDRGNLISRVAENAWRCYPTAATFGNMGAFTGGEHFFCKEVLEHL
jgi:hypothetical protein